MENLHMDLAEAVALRLNELPWLTSPGGEVERRMLEREAAESGRATSVVRYRPGSRFPTHTHGGGEEYLVLDGVFSDGHGDGVVGTYVRNPPGSQHAPFSADGCTIFVKLCQMRNDETERHVVIPERREWMRRDGLSWCRLFEDRWEQVDLIDAVETTEISLGGLEVLVLGGGMQVEGASFEGISWLRAPAGDTRTAVLREGARLWTKRGHL
jgi:anti-sigma factor ChrR (cupin superfamily)